MAAVFVVSLLQGIVAGRASAQELRPSLRMPTTLASVAAAADWASTYHALTNYHVRETNVLLQPFQKSPGKLVAIGAALPPIRVDVVAEIPREAGPGAKLKTVVVRPR